MKSILNFCIFFLLNISFLNNGYAEPKQFRIGKSYKWSDQYKLGIIQKILEHKNNINTILFENAKNDSINYGLNMVIPQISKCTSKNNINKIDLDSLIENNFSKDIQDVDFRRFTYETNGKNMESSFRDSIIVLPKNGNTALEMLWNLDCQYWYLSSVRCIKVE